MENGALYPPVDMCVDARAVYDAVAASDVCDPAESSLKLHLISVRDRMAQGILRYLYWVDTRSMVADGLTKGGIDRTLLDAISERCRYVCEHEPLRHCKVESLTRVTTCREGIGSENKDFKEDAPLQTPLRRRTVFKPRTVNFLEGKFLVQ